MWYLNFMLLGGETKDGFHLSLVLLRECILLSISEPLWSLHAEITYIYK
jgi:hypothetical protein